MLRLRPAFALRNPDSAQHDKARNRFNIDSFVQA